MTSIGLRAYSGCSGFTTVSIPNSVTSIGNAAFDGCSGLTSIIISNSLTGIGSSTFANCPRLTSITIPNSVTSIGYGAFQGCSALSTAVIGTGVTSIDDNAFGSTRGDVCLKKTIWLTNTPPTGYNNAWGTVNFVSNDQYGFSTNKIVYPFLSSMFEVDGVKYVPVSPSERTCDAIDCVNDESTVHLKIGPIVTYNGISMKVQKVQPYIFYGNKYLESISLGDNITSIGEGSFQNCTALKTVTPFSDNILEGIIIPASVKSIGNYAFAGCAGLKNLIIDDREVELSLGSNGKNPLFADCPLDSVYIGGNISYLSYQCYSPFYRNMSLRTVVITDKEDEISANEFYGCTNLQSFTIGDGVKKFGDWAFSGCSSLESLSFGSQLESIGREAFSDCNSVTQIVSRAAVAPSCGTQALDDINKWTCQLYVPKGCLASYQAADQWKEFFFIQEGDAPNGGGEGPTEPQQCATPTISYANGKLTFNCETEGAVCHSTITDTDIANREGYEIQLTATYEISVYAAKDGYDNSETAKATLCWLDAEPKTDGLTNDISSAKGNAILIQSNNGTLNISGVESGTNISVYTTTGVKVASVISSGASNSIATNLRDGEVVIVKIGDKPIKIAVK